MAMEDRAILSPSPNARSSYCCAFLIPQSFAARLPRPLSDDKNQHQERGFSTENMTSDTTHIP